MSVNEKLKKCLDEGLRGERHQGLRKVKTAKI